MWLLHPGFDNWYKLVFSFFIIGCFHVSDTQYFDHYTPSQRGNYHHSMFHNPTAAVNLFHVGKQYLTFCKAEAAVTHNVIGRKIIANVKHSDARNSLLILDVIRSSLKRHIAPQCVRVLQMNATSNDRCLLYAYIRAQSAISLSDGI